jgi:uncharacterized RDD family membrane protein YckC
MNRRLNSAFRRPVGHLLMIVLVVQLLATSVSQAANNVVAHASEDTLWISQIVPDTSTKPPGEKSALRYRALNVADQSWHELPLLPGQRIVQLAHRGQTSACLLSSGEWLMVWPEGNSVGPALPNRAKMLAIASSGNGDTIYAIAAATKQSNPETTEPSSTEPSKSTTEPALDAQKPTLYMFQGSQWKALANAPDTLAQAPGEISLAVIDRQPILAQKDSDGGIHVYAFDDDRKWVDRGSVALPAGATAFKLLSGTQRLTLWIGDASSGGWIYFGGEKWSAPIKLELSRPVNVEGSNLVAAAGAIRLFVADDKAKLYEQRYDTNGARTGDLAQLEPAQPLMPQMYEGWPTLALLIGLAFLMLSSARRRSAEEGEDEDADQIVIASAGQRLLAGLIDGVPLILSTVYITSNYQLTQDTTSLAFSLPIVISIAVYLLHTTVCELLSGRTIGKVIVGLQVVAADGKPARVGQILVRNLLRVVDIFPLLPLGFLIVVSPMKQRVGDLLAGTIVIIGPRATSSSSESDEEQKDDR